MNATTSLPLPIAPNSPRPARLVVESTPEKPDAQAIAKWLRGLGYTTSIRHTAEDGWLILIVVAADEAHTALPRAQEALNARTSALIAVRVARAHAATAGQRPKYTTDSRGRRLYDFR